MCVRGVGETLLNLSGKEIVANNVLHVPQFSVNLLSVSKICANNNSVHFNKKGCVIKNENNETIAKCKAENVQNIGKEK